MLKNLQLIFQERSEALTQEANVSFIFLINYKNYKIKTSASFKAREFD